MPENKVVITTLGGDETDQMYGESDAAYERRMAVLGEHRRQVMTRAEKDHVDELMKGVADARRKMRYV